MRSLRPEERICDLCSKNEIEDELHFLCSCTAYEEERKNLYDQVSRQNIAFPTLDVEAKFIYMMKNCNILISKYIRKAWNKRTNRIYN